MLVTAAQMREMDRRAMLNIGLSGIVLMERAALGAVEVLLDVFDVEAPTPIGILCGGGNNGGDGFAMARILHERGHDVWVGAMSSADQYPGDAAQNLAILEALDISVEELSDSSADELTVLLDQVPPCTIWVDALLGTGLERDIEGRYLAAVEFLNSQPRVLAVDISTGLHADSGQILGAAVRATATASLGLPKLAHALYPGRALSGRVANVDIGIPARVIEEVGWAADWLVQPPWAPRRSPTMHKGQAGRVLVIGGEPGKSGSVGMGAIAALRSGAGLVTVGTYDDVVTSIPTTCPEAMSAALLARTLEQRHEEQLEDLLEWCDVVVIGPGMGTHDGAFEVLETVLQSQRVVVADADALTLMAENRLKLSELRVTELVLTPHPGEAARLAGVATDEIVAHPVSFAEEIADDWDAIVVLKGAASVVATQDAVAINSTGNPGMASGGMGDALAGIIAAQLCEQTDAFVATCTAVWAHGAAGDRAEVVCGQRGLTVSALLDALPAVWRSLEDA